MTSQLLAATTGPDPTSLVALAGLALIGYRLVLIWLFPYAPCRSCHGAGRHRSGHYWRPCRRCTGTGRRIRLGRRVWDWTRASSDT